MEENMNTPAETTDIELSKTEPLETEQPTAEMIQEPQAEADDEAETKEGLWARIVHSKDSTKLIASVAFCAVFAACTLFATAAFGGPQHSGNHGGDTRMEQFAHPEKGSMPDDDASGRSHGKSGMDNFKMRDESATDSQPSTARETVA